MKLIPTFSVDHGTVSRHNERTRSFRFGFSIGHCFPDTWPRIQCSRGFGGPVNGGAWGTGPSTKGQSYFLSSAFIKKLLKVLKFKFFEKHSEYIYIYIYLSFFARELNALKWNKTVLEVQYWVICMKCIS